MAPRLVHAGGGLGPQRLRHALPPPGPGPPPGQTPHRTGPILRRPRTGLARAPRRAGHLCVPGHFAGGIRDGLCHFHRRQSAQHLRLVPGDGVCWVRPGIAGTGPVPGAGVAGALFAAGQRVEFLRPQRGLVSGLRALHAAQRHDPQGRLGGRPVRHGHYDLQHGGRRAGPLAQVELQEAPAVFGAADGDADGHYPVHGHLWQRRVLGLWGRDGGPHHPQPGQSLVGDLCQVRAVSRVVSDVSDHDVSHLEHSGKGRKRKRKRTRKRTRKRLCCWCCCWCRLRAAGVSGSSSAADLPNSTAAPCSWEPGCGCAFDKSHRAGGNTCPTIRPRGPTKSQWR
mmetsp:Transcript_19128/g.44320  ORF Transcript_19128/g.44320 Transcript_19128/m.44320 type:complete len:339 (-) Transcript_19128:141-1157(-)